MFLLVLISAMAFLSSGICAYSCVDENNNPVDWFVIYKIPELKDNKNPFIRDGTGYAYSSSTKDTGWILSQKSINDSTSVPGLTLSFFYDASSSNVSKDTLFVLYNDQPPNGETTLTGGHTKGVVVAGKSGGFWLVHSVPHYPPPPDTAAYSYPHTGLRNGQSFLCITLKPQQLETVGLQLMFNDPKIFANSTPVMLDPQYPQLTKAALGADITSPPYYHSDTITSSQGTVFHTFAKTPKFDKDLYADWVAAALQANLLVETWPNGVGRLNSSCDHPYSVENVEGVNINVVGESFHSTKDHSKWAVSESKDNPWICIGDINRAMTQALRGGGTVCVSDPKLWRAYFESINSVQSCPKPSVHLV
ncbi:plancitoxin-1-like [Macrosteles quadrilineatus]|uniref:plancitoxin-1-like n=1 Tax=Macrosteles quadrilineatus TaxID=74068 RepID=UPI0023E11122|nr:plancitoxin-1-like [Macrosteles quadrilineatus]XP_054271237.1 plancitoxin-1-like [Macrosteles quadrilineatus]XP_054271238.1 plancitoxin-1-like [Macrosteles quadrilineatus]XP_054271240.1 plancitoxin-1-like [Macrosteles quadrilineatus]